MIDLSQNFLVKGDKTKVGSVSSYYNLFAVKTQLRKIEGFSATKISDHRRSRGRLKYLCLKMPLMKNTCLLASLNITYVRFLLNYSLLAEQYFFIDILIENLECFNLKVNKSFLQLVNKESFLLLSISSTDNHSHKFIKFVFQSIFASFFLNKKFSIKFFKTEKELIAMQRRLTKVKAN